MQQPHPPIWIAARSAESVEWCVKRHLPCAQVYQTTGQIEDTFSYYRTKAKEAGWDAKPEQFILCRHIYIDDTEQKARANVEAAMAYFFTVFNRGFNEAINKDAVAKQLQAALTSERSFSYFREGNRERFDFSKMDFNGLIQSGYLIAGNPDSVAKADPRPDATGRRRPLHGHVPHRQLAPRQSDQLARSIHQRNDAEIALIGRNQ